jgi:hypothetical protein
MRNRRAAVWFALAMFAVLAWAWWDGGREPLHPIEQEIPVPEGVE